MKYQVYIHQASPSQVGRNSRSIVNLSKTEFEFSVFLLQDWLPKQGSIAHSAQQFSHI